MTELLDHPASRWATADVEMEDAPSSVIEGEPDVEQAEASFDEGDWVDEQDTEHRGRMTDPNESCSKARPAASVSALACIIPKKV